MGTSLYFRSSRLRKALEASCCYSIRWYSATLGRSKLFAQISPIGGHTSISPVLDQWVDSGNKIGSRDLGWMVRDLRKRRRYAHALEVIEWICNKDIHKLRAGEHALRLDLIGRIRGWESAEAYFDSLGETDKNEKTHGALLNCYVREKLTDKSLAHVQKMKQLGLASTPVPYDSLMSLYTTTGQYENVPELLAEMKDNKVVPCNFSYRVCLNSYGARSDIKGMEMVLEEMEGQDHITMDWNTYAAVANAYIEAGLNDKAALTIKKAEDKLSAASKRDGYCRLVSLNGTLGNKSEVNRLWNLLKSSCKKVINRDYTVMLKALVKLNELEEAESLLKEWETCGNEFDFRVPSVLLNAYCEKSMPEKAESMFNHYRKKGVPRAETYQILAAGFKNSGDEVKALEYTKRAEEIKVES